MKDLQSNRASRLLRDLVSQGEHETQDFKLTVNDPRKIARTVSAFANNRGGQLLIGVDDNGVIKGVRSEEDIYVVESAAQIYCQPSADIGFTSYKDKGGATVIIAEVRKSPSRPVCVKEEDNWLKAYYRVADENILAHPLMVRCWKFADSGEGVIYSDLDSGRSEILTFLADGDFTPDELLLKVRMSRKSFEKAIVELYSLKLVDFIFSNRSFKISRKP